MRNALGIVLMPVLLLVPAAYAEPSSPDDVVPVMPPSSTVRQNANTSVTFEKTKDDVAAHDERWSDFLPIWGQEAKARGYVLPLPFGVSINNANITEPVKIKGLRLVGGSGAEIEVPAQFVRLDPTEAVNNSLRFDVWVFPFLNVYALAAKTSGHTDFQVNLPAASLPILPSLPPTCPPNVCYNFPGFTSPSVRQDFDGDTYGGGLTLAGGVGNFFGVFDANYTETDLDILKDRAKAVVLSARLGWNGHIGDFTGQFWVGAMQQNLDQTVQLPLSNMVPGAQGLVEVDVYSAANITPLAGMSWQISREWNVMTEYSKGEDREFLLGSLNYRF
jgi:hypothetical protein